MIHCGESWESGAALEFRSDLWEVRSPESAPSDLYPGLREKRKSLNPEEHEAFYLRPQSSFFTKPVPRFVASQVGTLSFVLCCRAERASSSSDVPRVIKSNFSAASVSASRGGSHLGASERHSAVKCRAFPWAGQRFRGDTRVPASAIDLLPSEGVLRPIR